jgi:hypothetical protein
MLALEPIRVIDRMLKELPRLRQSKMLSCPMFDLPNTLSCEPRRVIDRSEHVLPNFV